MKKLLRNIWKLWFAKPKLKLKVELHRPDKPDSSYAAYWSKNDGVTWQRFLVGSTFRSNPYDWRWDMPVLFDSFDSAVDFARRFGNISQVEEWQDQKHQEWLDKRSKALDKWNGKIDERNLVWES